METEFKDPADIVEWVAVTHNVIAAFEDRGYGLYPLRKQLMLSLRQVTVQTNTKKPNVLL